MTARPRRTSPYVPQQKKNKALQLKGPPKSIALSVSALTGYLLIPPRAHSAGL